ncbi:3'-5' exonuclease [Pleurocapsales cyanobacterium LEGE 10410]|nr:3'-5' exonuclease [Pleurocapsales cyanobacterium LEGE 10410]
MERYLNPFKPLDFVVIDTEGRRELREIAIINHEGKLIYEALNQEHPQAVERAFKSKPLQTILLDFLEITRQKILVFHHALHDIQVLKNSFKKVNLAWQNPSQVHCTHKLAQQSFPQYCSYSLEYLSKKLNLKVDRQYFDPRQAHVARYDALFTYQLYLAIQHTMSQASIQVNPFGSSRVDNPFQSHPDNSKIYHAQYTTLESVIDDIKYDPNHQSKGAVVIGKPGTGKTHLIMRLAKRRLELNRLLFVPCPNDANTIKYHTYSCILESLNKSIPGTRFNQLEYFLANTFVGIIKSSNHDTQKIKSILDKIQNEPLKLYEILGGEGTKTRRNNWDSIEKITTEWWFRKYGATGYAPEIIKGIVRFCRYSDLGYKQLVKKWLAADELEPEELDKIGLSSWHNEISKEDFSLEAIAVLGKLSLLHEPLIMVFDQLEMLGLKHNQNILLNFGEAVKEIFTLVPHALVILNLFPERWQQLKQTFDGSIIDRISQHQIFLEQPTADEIKDILQLKAQQTGTGLTNLFTSQEIEQIIGERRSIRAVLNNAAEYFRYKYKNIPLPEKKADNNSSENLLGENVLTRLNKLEAQQNRLEKLLQNIAQAFNTFTVPDKTSVESEVANHNPTHIPRDSSNNLSLNLVPTLEEKVRGYLETQQTILEQDYNEAEILLDEKDVGKLQDIIEALKKITELDTDVLPSKRVLPPHRIILNKNLCIGFLSSCKGSKFTSRIQNYNEFVATKEQIRFLLWRDVRSDVIRNKTIGSREISKLNNTKNGEFMAFDRNNRITFELIHKFISDIYNQDLEIDLDTELEPALKILADYFREYWLIEELL